MSLNLIYLEEFYLHIAINIVSIFPYLFLSKFVAIENSSCSTLFSEHREILEIDEPG